MIRTVTGFCLLSLTLIIGCAGASDAGPFVDWLDDHRVVVGELDAPLPAATSRWLGDAVGSARLVGLGESRHDTREQTLLKTTLIRCLVEDHGFRAVILEESFPHAEALDHYVTTGEGDPRDIMNGLAGWYLWDTEEMLALVQWVRRFNDGRGPADQVRFLGMDVSAPAPGVREVVQRLREAGVETGLTAAELGLELHEGDFWPAIWERYQALSAERWVELTSCYDKLVSAVEAARPAITTATSPAEYERLLLLAEIGRHGNAMFVAPDVMAGGVHREQGMAATALWILDRMAPDRRAVAWAHNLHVIRRPFRMPAMGEGAFEPMGMLLDDALGDGYVVVGGTFGSGAFPGDLPPGERVFAAPADSVLDGALARSGEAAFLVDLREIEPGSPADDWSRQDREWVAQDARAVIAPIGAVDLLYFVPTVSRAEPTPLALQRFQGARP